MDNIIQGMINCIATEIKYYQGEMKKLAELEAYVLKTLAAKEGKSLEGNQGLLDSGVSTIHEQAGISGNVSHMGSTDSTSDSAE